MAPQLGSDDEISEMEEVSETFIIVSAKNSPLIERKETSNMDINEVENFTKDINSAKSDTKLSSFMNGKSKLDPDPPDKDVPGKLIGGPSSNKKDADTEVTKITTNQFISAHNPQLKKSEKDVTISGVKFNSEEDQENIRPDKLKAKNKLNLKLNFNKKADDKSDQGATNGHPATLNLPSPVTCLTSDKTSKVKRDSKKRVKVSKTKVKVPKDTKSTEPSSVGTSNELIHPVKQNDSKSDITENPKNHCETLSNAESIQNKKTTRNECQSDIKEQIALDDTSTNKTVECIAKETGASTTKCDHAEPSSNSSGMKIHAEFKLQLSNNKYFYQTFDFVYINFFISDPNGCDCLERKTPGIDEMIRKSTVLRKSSSEKSAGKSRRRGSLPSPPLQPFLIKESIHRARKDSGSFEEEPVTPTPENHDENTDADDFRDEEEEEIVVLFQQNVGCDDNEESDEDENSWSPSSLSDDDNDVTNEKSDPKVRPAPPSRLPPPELEEENGKTKVTEKFMKDLIR